MSKQFRINHIVEAVQWTGHNVEECAEFYPYFRDFVTLRQDDYIVRSPFNGQVTIVDSEVFRSLYFEVNE